MLKYIKIMVSPLLLTVILAALFLSGCGDKGAGSEEPGGGMTGAEAKQLVVDSTRAMNDVNSYTFSMDMEIDMEAVGGSSPGTVGVTMESEGAADVAAKKMKMSMKMSLDEMDIQGQTDDMMQDISVEMYMIEDKIYMMMDIPEMGEQWVQMPNTAEMEEAYDLNMLDNQLELLETAVDIQYLKSEKVDGSDCYVLKVDPDMAAMMDWLGSQEMATGGMDFGDIDNAADVFKELSYKVWIDKDSKLVRQMHIDMVMEMNAEEFGAADEEFDKVTMDISMGMNIRDFNKSVSIEVPEEAEDAPVMPG